VKRRVFNLIQTLVVILLVTSAGNVFAQEQLGPIDSELRTALDAVRADKKPKETIRGKHYIVSNEHQLHLFHKAVQNRGGMYIGVGADQNYLMAGWSKPDVLVLLDFDQVIVDLHDVYAHFFRMADTPEDFLSLWKKSNQKKVAKKLKKAAKSKKWGKRLVKLHRESIWAVYPKLKSHMKMAKEQGIPTFLTDLEQYQTVSNLYQTNRVLAVRGDLTEDRTLNDLSAIGKRFSLPIRVLYLSNCEYYFKYGDKHYRENILAMPFDAQSVVLHTDPKSSDAYRYVHHSGANFQAWIQCPCVKGIRSMMRKSRMSEDGDLRVIEGLPSEQPCCSPETTK